METFNKDKDQHNSLTPHFWMVLVIILASVSFYISLNMIYASCIYCNTFNQTYVNEYCLMNV